MGTRGWARAAVAAGAAVLALSVAGPAGAQYVGGVPPTAAADSCVQGGTEVTYRNPGTVPVTLLITKDGAPVGQVALGPGESGKRLFPMGPTEKATFRVTGPGLDTTRTTDMSKCPAAPVVVKSSLQERGGAGGAGGADILPVTGGDLVGLAAIGAAAVALGTVLVRRGRRRPTTS